MLTHLCSGLLVLVSRNSSLLLEFVKFITLTSLIRTAGSSLLWRGSWIQPMPGAPLTHYFQWNISGSNLALLYERSHTILHILFFLEDIFFIIWYLWDQNGWKNIKLLFLITFFIKFKKNSFKVWLNLFKTQALGRVLALTQKEVTKLNQWTQSPKRNIWL